MKVGSSGRLYKIRVRIGCSMLLLLLLLSSLVHCKGIGYCCCRPHDGKKGISTLYLLLLCRLLRLRLSWLVQRRHCRSGCGCRWYLEGCCLTVGNSSRIPSTSTTSISTTTDADSDTTTVGISTTDTTRTGGVGDGVGRYLLGNFGRGGRS